VTDDGEPVEGWGGGNWDPALPHAPEGFPERLAFQITSPEAAYLQERVILSCSDSLLATLLDGCNPVENVAFIWQHPQLGAFPEEQRAWLIHARNFSEMMYGAVLLYNLMLAECSKQGELVEKYKTDLEAWRETLERRSAELVAWDRKAFWELVTRKGQTGIPTRRFVSDWLNVLLAGEQFPDLANCQEARALVRDREVWLKRGRSRFESQRHLEMWSGAAGIAQLEYRWFIARRITNDILHGLGIS